MPSTSNASAGTAVAEPPERPAAVEEQLLDRTLRARRPARGGGAGMGVGSGAGVTPPEEFEGVPCDAAAEIGAAHAASEAAQREAQEREPEFSASWADNPSAFQAAYRAARERRARGEAAVEFMTDDATGGLGARQGGRAFGVEIEFDVAPGIDRHQALAAIGRDLHAAGLTNSPEQRGYHARPSDSAAGLWRFEADSTVAGEIVSPIAYDEPRTWAQLAQVCEIVRRHGGVATQRTGGHVHVGVGDYDHTVGNHNNLLAMFQAHEDVLYRLAQNPTQRQHRGTDWCAPNRVPAAPYFDPHSVRYANQSHRIGVNFQSVSGRTTDHVEFRMWDSSLDPGVIQAQVKLSLGMAHAAFRSRGERWAQREPIGAHRTRNASLGRGRRLRGDAWQADTASFRQLVDRIFTRDQDRAQATALLVNPSMPHSVLYDIFV